MRPSTEYHKRLTRYHRSWITLCQLWKRWYHRYCWFLIRCHNPIQTSLLLGKLSSARYFLGTFHNLSLIRPRLSLICPFVVLTLSSKKRTFLGILYAYTRSRERDISHHQRSRSNCFINHLDMIQMKGKEFDSLRGKRMKHSLSKPPAITFCYHLR